MRNWMLCSLSDAKQFKLRIKICELEGLVTDDIPNKDTYKVQVHINLGIPKRGYVPRITNQKDHTSKQQVGPDGRVCWNEGFEHRCNNLDTKGVNLKSWKINLQVHGIDVESNNKADILAKIKMDVAEFTNCSEKPVKLPVKCCIGSYTHEAKLKVKLEIIEVQKPQTENSVHPISPTHLLPSLLSCVNFQNQTRNKTENMKMEMENSQSETEEGADQGYKRIKMLELLRSQSLHEGIEYRKQDKQQASGYEYTEKIKLKRLLSWNIKKPKDAPLLNKEIGGGDDIDNERRTLMSYLKPKDSVKKDIKNSEFMGSDRFEVGKWEKKRVKSRDGKLELQTDIFLATIDQRSEKALGEGACTVIATVIADWLHRNPNNLPLRCEFDKLIRDGSREWRKLCKEDIHKGKFLDQHFDLETVIQAEIRPLEVVSEKSYVGFFKLENMMNKLDLLQDAMSFDTIWNEIENGDSSLEERVYIVSWNDHFFVLKKENKEMYIIDTLGERLAEGCKKAYILKFNEDSVIHNVEDDQSSIICKGTSCCKEFIKGFLAAIPLGELQSSVEKGINGKAPLHQLLQIEFQYMWPLQQNSPIMETIN
ncbi:uncharacterized protein LOC111888289 [Lactuca sativa]|uniref:C2 NT-type domain-containing protein n=1 Tax=Lactuca sativa TaxID=4236 RepID=A0A9R1WC47_LACSA|nr:uncharacterized protein LOC111888289 [Lactuca sativa]KAJ0221009.1 hypothetical protein LSAT_V11C200092840 [Lactuca sativa]